MSTERTYFYNIGSKGKSVETKPNDYCTQVNTPTGRILMTIYGDAYRTSAWASFKIEMSTVTSVIRKDGVNQIGESTSHASLGGMWHSERLSPKTSVEDVILSRIAVWLSCGEIGGQSCDDAVWTIIWSALKGDKDLRHSLAEYYPQWIKGLDLDK